MLYKFAAQNKLRFESIRGQLTVDQLFELPLTSKDGFNLNDVAKGVNNELKTKGEESFVDNASNDPRKKVLEVMLEIIKDVIKTKQDENAAKANRLKKAEDRKKILDILAAKRDEKLSAASIEELEKQLAAIDAS